jgi:hypothetical protein
MPVYRDDPDTPEDEGLRPGEEVSFTINGVPARPDGPDDAIWTTNGALKQVNLIASSVKPTNEWVNFYSQNTILNGQPVPVGTLIEAFDPQGTKCGETIVNHVGWYGLLPCYRDDPDTPEDEGAMPGDTIAFRIAGSPATAGGPDAPQWTSNGDIREVNLVAGIVTPTPTCTPTPTPTATHTPTPTATFTNTPTPTNSRTPTSTPTEIPTPTNTPTATPTTLTPTSTPTASPTTTPTSTSTATPTSTTTNTPTPTSTPCVLFGDFDGDGKVTVTDIQAVASRWRTSCASPDPDNNPATPNYEARYDLDHDCDIDIVDIMLVSAHWGDTCGGIAASAAPSPDRSKLEVSIQNPTVLGHSLDPMVQAPWPWRD